MNSNNKEEVKEWIDVNKQLPDNRAKVLFFTNRDIMLGWFLSKYIDENVELDNVFIGADKGLYRLDCKMVTYWMYLPPTPIFKN